MMDRSALSHWVRLPRWFDDGARAVAVLLGLAVVGLAGAVAFTQEPARALMLRVETVVGVVFPPALAILLLIVAYAAIRLWTNPSNRLWRATGLQAASGIATLALTFTLFGISLGIGTLAKQPLTPDTVQAVIGDLTGRFSLAFMTTVIGLPVSALARALLMVLAARAVNGERS